MFIDDYDPYSRTIPRQTVYDFANNLGYVYNPTGDFRIFDLREPNAEDNPDFGGGQNNDNDTTSEEPGDAHNS
jgi:hypothetical protein